VAFVRKTLVDVRRRTFMSSQSGVDAADYYALDVAARASAEAPFVDPSAYVGPNAQMAAAFVKAGLVLGDDATLELGAVVLDGLLKRARFDDDTLLGHLLAADGPEGPVLLSSQVHTARALVDCHEALGGTERLTAAAHLLDEVHARLYDPARQAYADTMVELGAEGYLSQPIIPLAENAVAADTLLRLALLLDAPAYQTRALGLLRALAGGAGQYGYVAAPLALATLRSLATEPVTFAVAAADGQDVRPLVRAAHALYVPFKVVRFLDPERDASRLRALRLSLEHGPVVVVSRGAAAAEPTNDPARVLALVARAAA
jgi:uncharacterized protein YyaL (SSP411 family)